MRRLTAVLSIIAALVLAVVGCGETPRPRPSARLALPLPPDTLRFDAPEVGVYGGRFVIAQTSDPKSFNALLANEMSSTIQASHLNDSRARPGTRPRQNRSDPEHA